MKILTILFIFVICLISVLAIIGLEYFFDNFFLIPLIESVVIFLAILFLLKFTKDNYFAIVFIFAIFFILLENGVYALAIGLNMVDLGYKEVLSWRFLYNTIFIFIYIPLLCYGIKSKDKILMFFYFLIGTIGHLIFNLLMQVVS